MTRAPLLPFGVTKEIRALLPTWLGAMIAIAAAAGLGSGYRMAGALAYLFGALALGALSIGHEYTHHTLALLLSQPARRERLYLVKLGVLTPMLLTLGAVAWVVLFNSRPLYFDFDRGPLNPLVPVLCGLLVAPWLTMVCRNPLGGVVFAIAIPALIVVGSTLLAFARYGLAPAHRLDMEHFARVIQGWGLVGFCAFAAVSGWRRFMRLEAIEGRDPEVHLPRWLRRRTPALRAATAADAAVRHPLWMLTTKELRLQQMTFVVAGLYMLLWTMASVLMRLVPSWEGFPLAAISGMYGALLALLIGSLASAEERQFGTLEWQVLLPVPTARQWAVKAGVALGLAMLLAFALPILLSAPDLRPTVSHGAAIVVLTTGSLYVSSLCTSGLRALMLSGLVMLVGAWLMGLAFSQVVARLGALPALPSGAQISGMLTGVVALALWFALENHRTAKQDARRVVQQVLWMAGVLAAGVAAVAVVTAA